MALQHFSASPTEIDPGDEITLTWLTSGGSKVQIWRLRRSGQYGDFWDVPASGSLVIQSGTNDREQLTYLLFVSDEDDNYVQSGVTITIRCPGTWFFEPAPEGCPGTSSFSPAVEQQFEGGRMIWMEETDYIWVILTDGQHPAWRLYSDTWLPGEPESDPSIVPPSGYMQPVRGFGEVWRNEASVRERLGWAITGEQSFDGAYQSNSASKYNNLYLRTADGRVIKLLPEFTRWEWVAP